MELAREARAVTLAGYAIERAHHEAVAQPLQERFLNDFLDLIPVAHNNSDNKYGKLDVSVKRPEDIPPAQSFGLVVEGRARGGLGHERAEFGLCIGEHVDAETPSLTDVLIAHQINGSNVPTVRRVTVDSVQWRATRDKHLARMTNVEAKRDFADRYNPEEEAFVLPVGDFANLLPPDSWNKWRGLVEVPDPRANERAWKKAVKRGGEEGGVTAFYSQSRRIKTSDFSDFGMPYHLELLAAAFGVENEFDELKSQLHAELPKSTDETFFGKEILQ